MERNEMIEALVKAGIRAVPTVVTFDMGLQYDYSTPQGAGTGFGGMASWPLWKFHPLTQEKWNYITQRIKDKQFEYSDLVGTEFEAFVDDIAVMDGVAIDYVSLFSGLLEVQWTKEPLYCLFDTRMWYDPHASAPVFSVSKDSILESFVEEYCLYIESWNEMDDDDLTSWYDRLSDDLAETPFQEFEN